MWCTYSVYNPQTLGHCKFAVHIRSNIPLTSIFWLYIHGIHHITMIYILHINPNANGGTFQLWITAWKIQPSQAKVSDITLQQRLVILYVAWYCRLIAKVSTSGSIIMYEPQLHLCWYMCSRVDMFVNQPHYHALYNTNWHTPLVTRSNFKKALLIHMDGHESGHSLNVMSGKMPLVSCSRPLSRLRHDVIIYNGGKVAVGYARLRCPLWSATGVTLAEPPLGM